uniref:Uncharacterized protein n=1 Tax=Peronospora matthiolae TaxID=2874970 RepID=A0AAV1TFT2_9STRA
MQNQVEALYLDGDKQIMERMVQEKTGDLERGTEFLSTFGSQAEAGADQGLTRAVTRDGVGIYTSDKWAEFYLTSEVAVVTNIGHPPVPPRGYIPLRHGHGRDLPNASTCTFEISCLLLHHFKPHKRSRSQ